MQPLSIAIVGVAGRFPGAADERALYNNVRARISASKPVPAHRWPAPASDMFDPSGSVDHARGQRACLLDDFELDQTGLALPAEFLSQLSLLHKVTLDVGARALRNAGLREVDRARIGVILANIALPTDGASKLAEELFFGPLDAENLGDKAPLRRAQPIERYPSALPVGLLATALGLGGGTYTLDAACASSLYALYLACQELSSGRMDAVIAGGVSVPQALYTQVGFTQLTALSPSGVCAPFDTRADGLVVGEGAGMFVLRRLSDAEAAGERILGVIRGVGLSNDVGGSLLSPDTEGQLRATAKAYAQAGWSPSDVDLIECHGTGTPRGDAVELESLRSLFQGAERTGCVIGSVKSNVGHLLTAAGAAGLCKVLAALEHHELPPQANFAQASASPGVANGPFRVLEAPEPWAAPASGKPRRAAVSGFGFGGINAHLLVEEYTSASAAPPVGNHVQREPLQIAIVGMGAHVGSKTNLTSVQHALFRGEPERSDRPKDRWGNVPSDPMLGAWIGSYDMPLGRFRIPPKEMAELLPQQLLMLKVAAEAWDDVRSHTGKSSGANPRAGAVVGLGLDLETTNFHLRWLVPARIRAYAKAQGLVLTEAEVQAMHDGLCAAIGPGLDATRTMGALGGIVTSRLAREFQLGGPSFGVSGEEASGLRALEVAARLLQDGQADLMLVGAVDLAGDVRQALATDALRRWSRTGTHAPFDERADGPVLAEGAVALVLKRLPDALRDGDRVYAVLQGLGAAGGAALQESESRQETYLRAVQAAQAEAQVAPADVSLLVGHGSGDPVQDACELRALCLGLPAADEPRCALAAASSVLGHAGAASGLCNVVLAALCLSESLLPPTPGYTKALEPERLAAAGLHVLRDARAWLRDRARGPRRAGVSSMGIDGSVVHALLESASDTAPASVAASPRPLGPRPCALFLCRGDNAVLETMLASHSGDIESLAARFYRQQRGAAGPVTRAIVAGDLAELRAELSRVVPVATPMPGALAFVFPGSGTHYVGMGADLGAVFPSVYRALDGEVQHLAGHLMPGWVGPYRARWDGDWAEDARQRLASAPERMILGQVAHGIAVSDVVRSFGVSPTAYLGYSLGESAGLFASRTWRDRDVMFQRTLHSTLFTTELCGPCTVVQEAWGKGAEWRVALVYRTAQVVRESLVGTASLLIVNTHEECVVGGKAEDVAATLARLDCASIDIEGVPTVHLPVMKPVAPAYRALHVLPCTPPAGVTFYSGAWARTYVPTPDDAAESIVTNALAGFDFTKTVLGAYDAGVRVFVELGPQNSCTRMISRILAGRPHLAVSACHRDQPGLRAVLACIGKLAEAGIAVDLGVLYAEGQGIDLETKPAPRTLALPVGPARPLPPRLPMRVNSPPLGSDLAPPPKVPTPAPAPVRPATRPVTAPPRPIDARPETAMSSVITKHEPQVAAPSTAALTASTSAPLATAPMHGALATAAAHEAFLRLSASSITLQTEALLEQQRLLAQLMSQGDVAMMPEVVPAPVAPAPVAPAPVSLAPVVEPTPHAEVPAFDYAMCMEFAIGSIGKMLGPEFAVVDTHPTRVRLPDEPLMLCHRIMSVEGQKGVLGPGRCVTEHDVVPGAWYLDAGRTPVCISVEAGQADLFLSAYLGIDFETKGERVYRLLDAKIVFHRGLPVVGETIRYDIRIDRFIRQGDTWLFFFRFDGTIQGQPFITMYDGCAGFFSNEQLSTGRGVVGEPGVEAGPRRKLSSGQEGEPFAPLLPRAQEALGADCLEALRAGDLGAAFGGVFQGRTLAPALRLPRGRMELVHRITELDTQGGALGLGYVYGEADVTPDAWYLTCHFTQDPVMPGTLMYECCLHTLRVLLLRMGLCTSDTELDVHYAPIEGIASQLRCRGQVLPSSKVVGYRVEIKEMGYDPAPYVLANAAMYVDGRYVVEMVNMSVRMPGLTRQALGAYWGNVPAAPSHAQHVAAGKPPVFTREQILAYAEGNPSECFGERYRVFDNERRLARLPRPPFMFVDRVTSCEPPPFVMAPGGWIECEFDVPPDVWYFKANRQKAMPFAVLLEAALQPCGFLAAYVGSALTNAQDMQFRNLDGHATCFEEVFRDSGTLTMRARLTKASEAGGMLLQEFDMEVLCQGRKVYAGHTGFGFFPAEALANQVGVRGASMAQIPEGARNLELAHDAPVSPEACDALAPWTKSDLSLPATSFLMIDRITCLDLAGGAAGLGFIMGEKAVNPDEWFFYAHFYQDPVMPGSLGLEALVQLMKVYAQERFPALVGTHRAQSMALGQRHQWQYRGQVIPKNGLVTVQCEVRKVQDGDEPVIIADGRLAVDGRVIYTMKDFGLRLVRDDRGAT